MNLLLAVLILWRPDPAASRPTHDFARLTTTNGLIGKRALYRIVLDSTEGDHDGFILYDCQTQDGTFRCVWLYAGQEFADEMVVEATLVVLYHPATVGAMGTKFEGFIEYRLTKAVWRQ